MRLYHYKETFKLAYPIVLTYVGQMLTQIVDHLMIGQLGTVPLAAVAFSHNVWVNVYVFAIGFTHAITTLAGKARGEKNDRRIALTLRMGLISTFVLCMILLVLLFIIRQFLHHMGQTKEVYTLAKPYFQIISFSLLPVVLFLGLKNFADTMGFVKIGLWVTMVANLINILFNYLLIYGHFGFPRLEVEGAGYGTLISRISLLLIMVIYIYLSPKLKPYLSLESLKGFKKNLIEIWKVGIGVGVQIVMEVLCFTIGAIMMGWISPETLAAHQIAIGVCALSYMMMNGVSVATTIRVSRAYGEKDYCQIRQINYSSSVICLFITIPSSIFFCLARVWIPSFYVSSEEVIQIAGGFLLIGAFFQISDALQVVALGILRGLKDINVPSYIIIVIYWGFALPFAYILAFELDLKGTGIWISFLVSLTLASIALYMRVAKTMKKEKIRLLKLS